MWISWTFLLFSLQLALWIPVGNGLSVESLYESVDQDLLINGVDKTKYVKLNTSIYLYGGVYDHIYINENGILTFDVEFPDFVNVPFPLEFAAIAPFYSNIDTTNANENTSISIGIIGDAETLDDANQLVQSHFLDGYQFKANAIIVATWQNVGCYRENNGQQNTFQVVIFCGAEQTYVQFLYPENGLNWLQSDVSESGLPDVRAQAGFISEDGQFLNLKGSGTESAKYLSELTNTGETGSWLFLVGSKNQQEIGIKEPDQLTYGSVSASEPATCADGGRLRCHTSARCEDGPSGYCCFCKEGFYGNGVSCLKNDAPLRVSGKVTGNINNVEINGHVQSYVVLTDGRSYTAISPVAREIGYETQLGAAFTNAIGWLFAKSSGNDATPNGYQITGGIFNYTSTLYFRNTQDRLEIQQIFRNLNAWDQLDVDVNIQGTIPDQQDGAQVSYKDADIEFNKNNKAGSISSRGQLIASVNNVEQIIDIDQQIDFTEVKCLAERGAVVPEKSYNKLTRLTVTYQEPESALRIGLISKVLSDIQSNACSDGTAQCGQNAVCIQLDAPEEYECQCANGFASYDNEPEQGCFDIDECSGNHICHADANCLNEPGGYSCRCRSGFYGNGHTCVPVDAETTTEYEPAVQSTTPNIPSLAPEHWLCDQCSPYAECFQGICQCRHGWNGDGIRCVPICPDGYVAEEEKCIPLSSDDELEVEPFCHKDGCSCATGYQLHEDNERTICLLSRDTADGSSAQLPCDVKFNCGPNATCEWVEIELQNRCVCNPGFEGNGFICNAREVSCLEEEICDLRASCSYDDALGRSVCKCDSGFVGDGRTCERAPECTSNENCVENNVCENGVCVCLEGYERDSSDICVIAGSCGGAFCARNAICQWDGTLHVHFCLCPEEFIGNGITECRPNPPPCNIRNNCGLFATCTPNYRNTSIYECVCDDGYIGDGFVCTLEPNCRNQPDLCNANAQCYQTGSEYQCICNVGFIAQDRDCLPLPSFESGFLLLGQGMAIVRVPLDGRPAYPVTTSSMIVGVDKDCSRGRIYWSDIVARQILSANYNGTDKQVFIKDDIISPEGVAVDWISRRIYWTDSTKDTIEVASLDNSTIRAVVVRKNLVNPRGIAVDPHSNKLYWSDWNRDNPKIEWSNLDGTEREILLSAPTVNLPNSLVISHKSGELCFADAGVQKIGCIDSYSRNLRIIVANASYPFGLTITDDNVYWTDWTTKKVESTDHNGNLLQPIQPNPLFGNFKMYGVTAITDACPLFHSLCLVNNGDCPADTICLPNSRAPSGRSCFGVRDKVVEDFEYQRK